MESTPKNINQDKVFSALSAGNRRKIIEYLHQKDSTLLELSESFSVSFQALSKHIKILRDAQIVTMKTSGKYRILSLNKNSLNSSLEWISYYSSFWNESFDKLDELINKNKIDGNL